MEWGGGSASGVEGADADDGAGPDDLASRDSDVVCLPDRWLSTAGSGKKVSASVVCETVVKLAAHGRRNVGGNVPSCI